MVPLKAIMKQLYRAATSNPWRPGHQRVSEPLPIGVTSGLHHARIQRSLERAARKTSSRAIKPLRRLFRNQGAVNDSIIEALFHLSAQTQELVEEIDELQKRVGAFEKHLRQLPSEAPDPRSTPSAE